MVAVMGVQGEAALDWDYIREWCARYETLELLEEAKSRASEVWEPGLRWVGEEIGAFRHAT